MPDTQRTLAALQALLADNVAQNVSPQDVRDFLVSAYPVSLNAKNEGAVGDDTADDTAKLQSIVTTLRTTPGDMIIPAGTYKITAPIDLGAINQRRIRGQGRSVTVIKQYTDNVPIFRANVADTHTITLEDMELAYNTQQSAAQTGAIAVYITNPGSAYFWHVNRVVIRNANTGIGTSAALAPFWSSHFSNIRIVGITLRGIDLVTASGLPSNTFNMIVINNTNLATVATGEAFRVSAASGSVVNGLDIEDWKNQVIHVFGGSTIVFNGLHLERIDIDTDFSSVIRVSDEGSCQINQFDLLALDVNVATAGFIFNVAGADARLIVAGLKASTVTLTSGICRLLTAGSTPKQIAFVDEPILDSDVSVPATADNARDAITQYGAMNTEIISTLTPDSATPSVAAGNIFKTANTVPTTYTNFTNSIEGQTIKVIFGDSNTTVDFTASNLKGNAGVDWSPAIDDHMTCIFDGTNWFCDISDNTV